MIFVFMLPVWLPYIIPNITFFKSITWNLLSQIPYSVFRFCFCFVFRFRDSVSRFQVPCFRAPENFLQCFHKTSTLIVQTEQRLLTLDQFIFLYHCTFERFLE